MTKIIGGYQSTKTNGEDFAITPYLFGVYVANEYKVFGIGFCWGWASVFIALAFNVPKDYPRFSILK